MERGRKTWRDGERIERERDRERMEREARGVLSVKKGPNWNPSESVPGPGPD